MFAIRVPPRDTKPLVFAYYLQARGRHLASGRKVPPARQVLAPHPACVKLASLAGAVLPRSHPNKPKTRVLNMKISTRTLLAAALLVALPTSGAMACTITNWNGTNTAAAANTGGPAQSIARYSGVCALSVDTGKYVVDNTPGTEGTYRARFYVLTKAVGGTVTVFKASASDNGGGAAVIEVDYTGSAFNFRSNGTTVGSGVSGIQANKWYSVEVFYKSGGNFTASVWGAGGNAEIGNVSGSAGTGTVGSAVLGVSSGTASTALGFDAFESTRSETTAIGRLCRGDATGDAVLNIQDRIRLNTEISSFGANAAPGQPDCNEDGAIGTPDRICLNGRIANFHSCP